MQIRSDRGWIRAGMAVLVAGVLGGGVIAAVGDPRKPHKLTADGVTGSPSPAGATPTQGAAAGPVTAPAEPEPEKKSDPEVGDKVLVGRDGGSVAVTAVEDNVSAGRLFGAGEGNKYIAAEVKGCSGPNEKNLGFEPAYFLLRLDDGTVHDPGASAKKPSLEGGKVPAGKCLSGWVTFTVREGALPTGVIYDGSSRLTWTVPLPKNAKATTTTTLKAGAATAASSTTTTVTSKKAASSSSTTSTTGSKAKVSSSTTTSTKPKGASASTSSSTTSTTGAKASSTTTTTKPGSTSTTKPSASSTTSTTAKQG